MSWWYTSLELPTGRKLPREFACPVGARTTFELTVRSMDGNCRNVTAGPKMTVATFRAEPSRKLTGARV